MTISKLGAAHSSLPDRILDAIPSIVIGVDRLGRVRFWNAHAAATLGLSTLHCTGRALRSLEIDWDWGQVTTLVQQALERGRGEQLDNLPFTRPGGDPGLLLLGATRIASSGHAQREVLLVGEEVTERRSLEAQLLLSQKMESIGQLAAGIAHEINTPAQYARDNTQFLQEAFDDLRVLLSSYQALAAQARDLPELADQARALEEAEEEADLEFLLEEAPLALSQALEGLDRIAKIVAAMRDFSHAGKQDRTAVDLNHCIETTATVARNEWKYSAELELDLDPSLPTVPCLRAEFNQVILNLLVNAVHAIQATLDDSGAKGRIRLATRRCGDQAEIEVADSGCGMPEWLQKRIFDPFFTTKEVGKGTGQGLAICHAVIVKKLGGQIEVRSEEGKGSRFLIRLPLEP